MLKFGLSPCPNDIFTFCGILEKRINLRNFEFRFYIEDVETLNSLCIRKFLDISKISAHAFFYLQTDYEVLSSGGAFCQWGPVAVVKDLEKIKNMSEVRVALPGRLTTASALMWFYWRRNFEDKRYVLKFLPFYKIMDKVLMEEVDIGVVIHEGRFVYSQKGLKLLVDLGQFWIDETSLPVPLGVIVAKKNLNIGNLLSEIIRESLKFSYQNKDFAIKLAKNYAQELDEEIIKAHIDYYVNEFSIEMGPTGKNAISRLIEMIKKEGVWS